MAGINFITRVDSFNTLPSEFPEVNKWAVLVDGDGYVVTELDDDTFRIEGNISKGGGFVGVSFKPECGVLSIGTPAHALSPGLMLWGLNRVKKDDWFIRVDADGLNEVEDEKRRRLYLQAQDIPDEKHVGIKPLDNGRLACRATTARERAQWIWRADIPEYLSGEFVPEDARDKVLQAAYEAVYAHPAQGEDLMNRFEEAAEEKAEELREQNRKIQSWRRDSEKLEEVREDRDKYFELAKERLGVVEQLRDKVSDLKEENRRLEKELKNERRDDKIARIKKIRDLLDIDVQKAKEIVETAS